MKKLELKHLASYLPYGLKFIANEDDKIFILLHLSVYYDQNPMQVEGYCEEHQEMRSVFLEGCKPILKPLSDLTKEELILAGFESHIDFLTHEKRDPILAPYWMIEYLFSKHYDVFGLIEKGLAIKKED